MRITQATYRPSPLRRIQSAGDPNHEQQPEKKKREPDHTEEISEKVESGGYVDQDGLPHIDTEA